MISNYNQLTIKQFLKCKTIADLEDDPIDRSVKMLAEITGQTVEEIEQLPLGELKSRLKEFSDIGTLPPDQKLKLKFRVGGKRFICVWRTQDLTAAQFFDVSHFCKDQAQILSNIHNILAAICVPMDIWGNRKKYDGSKHKDISALFYNEMKISQAYPIMLFFCEFSNQLTGSIQTFLGHQVEKVKESLLKRDGVGLQS